MGDVSFYQTSTDGFLAREKGGISAERIKNDPQFERTRENGAEFGRANSASRLVRTSLRALIAGSADSRMTSRFNARMTKVVKADTTSTRGMRNVADGDLTLLRNFEFNDAGLLAHTLYAPFTTSVDRAVGSVTINVPAFIPKLLIAPPSGATHAKLISGVAAVDFEANTYSVFTAQSAEIVLGMQEQPNVSLVHLIGPNNPRPIFVVLGIDFLQEVNGARYSLLEGKFNALSIIAVDAAAQ
jgi:hypothetical protein